MRSVSMVSVELGDWQDQSQFQLNYTGRLSSADSITWEGTQSASPQQQQLECDCGAFETY